eukprot:s414_g17.t1
MDHCHHGTWPVWKKLRVALAVLIISFPENFLGPRWPVGGIHGGFGISDLDENWRKRIVDLRDTAGKPRISGHVHRIHRSFEWIPWICGLVISGVGAQPSWAASGETEPSSWLWIVASFLAGGLCVRYSWATGSDAPKPLLNTMLQQTHGAAVLYAITAAGFMDVMPLPSEQPMTAAELLRRNRESGMEGKEAVLQQLLHLLATCEILEEREESNQWSFRHSRCSMELRSGGRGRSFVLLNFSAEQVRPWWRISEALQGDVMENPFSLEHGCGVFEFYSDPSRGDLASHFNRLMQQLSISRDAEGNSAASLVAELPIWDAAVDVNPVVVDVGGGVGHLLSTILARHPGWKGIVFDLPKVLEERDEAVDERMSFVAGSFFDEIPKGDVLLLKWILHDWDDVHCRKILAKLRDAMQESSDGVRRSPSRLLIIEQTVPEDDDLSEAAQTARANLNDLYLWVLYGGRERRVSDYAALIEAEGLQLEAVTQLNGFQLVAIECRRSEGKGKGKKV